MKKRLITKVAGILPVLLLMVIAAGAAGGTDTDDAVLVVLCELTGEDPGTYQVTDVLEQWLNTLYSDYGNVTVERSDQSFPFDESDYSWGAAQAQAEGIIREADLVLWGAYMVDGTRIRIALVSQLTYTIFLDPELGSVPSIFTREEAFNISDIAPTDDPPHLFALKAYKWLAWVYSSRGEYDICLSLLNRALAISDMSWSVDVASLLADRAELYLRFFDEPELALNDINAAIELEPDFSSLRSMKDQILARLESGTAVTFSENNETGSQLDSMEYYYTRAVALDLAERYEEALDYYDRTIACGGEDQGMHSVYVDRAMCNTYLGNIDAAVADIQKALELDPNDAWAYARLAEIDEIRGDFTSCLENLNAGIAVDPYNRYLFGNRARVNYHLGNAEAARIDALTSIDLYPADPDMYNLLGTIYAEEGSFDMAIESYSEAIALAELRGEIAVYITNRGACHSELGEYEEALSDLDDAITYDPYYTKAYLFRGVLNYALGDHADAAWDFRKVLELTDDPQLSADAQWYLDDMGF